MELVYHVSIPKFTEQVINCPVCGSPTVLVSKIESDNGVSVKILRVNADTLAIKVMKELIKYMRSKTEGIEYEKKKYSFVEYDEKNKVYRFRVEDGEFTFIEGTMRFDGANHVEILKFLVNNKSTADLRRMASLDELLG